MNRERSEINFGPRGLRTSLAILAIGASSLLPLEQANSVYAGETLQIGDLNGDGEVNKKDLRILKKVVKGWERYNTSKKSNADPHYWAAADINGDGRINKDDIKALKVIIRCV